MELKEQIKNYYFERLGELTPDKRFHFASRMAAWQPDSRSLGALKELKAYMVSDGPEQTLANILRQPIGNLYARQLRQPFFDRYPSLLGIHNAFFRIRHLREVYGVDWRDEFLRIVNRSKLHELYSSLTTDPEALRILSRFAIDYLYLYEIIFERPRQFEPQRVLAEFGSYDLNDNNQLHLLIYLFTHTIIADTNFYARPVPLERRELYRRMLDTVEPLLKEHDDHVKLDVKFEFLVACRICQRGSDLFVDYDRQAGQAISPDGSYIFDKLAGGPEAGMNSLERSEHRNVLFIMSGSNYPKTD